MAAAGKGALERRPVSVWNLAECGTGGVLAAEAERIFWMTATTREFRGRAEREAYRDRWFGRYLSIFPEWALVARRKDGVAGYLVGCPDTLGGPARPIVSDIFYYRPELLSEIGAWPAHFHVNVHPDRHGQGIGQALITAFAAKCRSERLAGFHVVTAARAPAAHFYEKCGFGHQCEFDSGGRRLRLYTMSL